METIRDKVISYLDTLFTNKNLSLIIIEYAVITSKMFLDNYQAQYQIL